MIRGIQERTGGFTEFVLLPFVHASSPIYLAGLARPGPTRRENRAVHAVSRLMLHGAIGSIQCSWVKLGDDLCRDVLQGGVNDLGGTLMEETISRMAGSQNGSYKTISQFAELVAPLGGRCGSAPRPTGSPRRSAWRPRRPATGCARRYAAARGRRCRWPCPTGQAAPTQPALIHPTVPAASPWRPSLTRRPAGRQAVQRE